MDYYGPLFVKAWQKVWILLFMRKLVRAGGRDLLERGGDLSSHPANRNLAWTYRGDVQRQWASLCRLSSIRLQRSLRGQVTWKMIPVKNHEGSLAVVCETGGSAWSAQSSALKALLSHSQLGRALNGRR